MLTSHIDTRACVAYTVIETRGISVKKAIVSVINFPKEYAGDIMSSLIKLISKIIPKLNSLHYKDKFELIFPIMKKSKEVFYDRILLP